MRVPRLFTDARGCEWRSRDYFFKPRQGKLRVSFSGGINLEIPDLSSYDLLDAKEKLDLEERAGFIQ